MRLISLCVIIFIVTGLIDFKRAILQLDVIGDYSLRGITCILVNSTFNEINIKHVQFTREKLKNEINKTAKYCAF